MARSKRKSFPQPAIGTSDPARSPGIELRLAIGRDGVGLELAAPTAVDCLRVLGLRTTLPGLRFPADVSGGVNRFRHRRAELLRLQLQIDARSVEAFAAPRLHGIVSPRSPEVSLGVAPARAIVTIAAPDELVPAVSVAPTLAFDIDAIAEEDIALVLSNVRGVNLPAHPVMLAVACVSALVGRHARRAGVEFTIPNPAATLLRSILPEAGARAPSVSGAIWSFPPVGADSWTLLAARDTVPSDPSEAATRAREAARLLRDSDDLLLSGDSIRARASYLEALERAPRHPEIVQRIADIDLLVSGREEAALGLLNENSVAPSDMPRMLGAIRSQLLARIGETSAAMAAFEEAVAAEPTPALSARLCELAALHARNPKERESWLDRALAIRPRAIAARWSRALTRLALDRPNEALGDVQHLDAACQRDRDRHQVWLRAGKAWWAAGLHRQAVSLFERALLHVPDEPEALAGLGQALAQIGSVARGTSLLSRAIDRASSNNRPTAAIALSLARILAEQLDDRPAAIARVSAIAAKEREAPLARGLEGRWRASLGDIAGATMAYASLRDLASSLAAEEPRNDSSQEETELRREIVALLDEAATFEETQRGDHNSAQAHRAAALRIRKRPAPDDAALETAQGAQAQRVMDRGWRIDLDEVSAGDPELAEQAEHLTRRFHANPDDATVATELARVLETLGRSHELLALLLGRLDDASPTERAALVPRVRATLTSLADAAQASGRSAEAALYRATLDSLA